MFNGDILTVRKYILKNIQFLNNKEYIMTDNTYILPELRNNFYIIQKYYVERLAKRK